MSWAYCGEDADGRPIGSAVEATCDEDGCDTPIDRGLAYACGGIHGADDAACDWYFCYRHLWYAQTPTGAWRQVCRACYDALGGGGQPSRHPWQQPLQQPLRNNNEELGD